jgi:hypothetical protein
LVRKLQSLSGRGTEEKNSQLLPGLEPPIIQPVTQRNTAELSQLLTLLKILFNIHHYHHIHFRALEIFLF